MNEDARENMDERDHFWANIYQATLATLLAIRPDAPYAASEQAIRVADMAIAGLLKRPVGNPVTPESK